MSTRTAAGYVPFLTVQPSFLNGPRLATKAAGAVWSLGPAEGHAALMTWPMIRRVAAAVAVATACSSCGGSAAAPAKEATSAVAASGATAQRIHYRCHAGRQDTI